MHPWFAGPDGQGRARLAANIAVGAAVPVLALAGVIGNRVPTKQALGFVAIAVVLGVALRYRGRWPLRVLLVTLLGVIGAVLIDRANPPLMVASEIAVFTVACLRPRRVAAAAALVSAVALFVVARTDFTGPMTEPRTLIVVVWTALAFAMGVAVRTSGPTSPRSPSAHGERMNQRAGGAHPGRRGARANRA